MGRRAGAGGKFARLEHVFTLEGAIHHERQEEPEQHHPAQEVQARGQVSFAVKGAQNKHTVVVTPVA